MGVNTDSTTPLVNESIDTLANYVGLSPNYNIVYKLITQIIAYFDYLISLFQHLGVVF